MEDATQMAEGVRWESDGKRRSTLEMIGKPLLGPEVSLVLCQGGKDLLTDSRVCAIMRECSDHVSVPILMPAELKDTLALKMVNSALPLYIPNQVSSDLWISHQHHHVKLCTRRVITIRGYDQFLSRYLRGVRGMSDLKALPLNISRESKVLLSQS